MTNVKPELWTGYKITKNSMDVKQYRLGFICKTATTTEIQDVAGKRTSNMSKLTNFLL